MEQDHIQPVFWFFYYIIPVYIAMPFLSILATKENKKVVEYIILLYIIGTGITIDGFILPLGIWLFFQHRFPKTWQPNPKTGQWLKRISGASLGVYVVHEFIIQIVTHFLHIKPDSLFHLLGLPLIVWLICLIIILILKRVPVLNKIIP